MHRVNYLVAVAIAAAALPSLPRSAAAQQPLRPVHVIAANAAADSLHRAALGLADYPRRYEKAARMHLRSASMRGPTDAQAVECLEMAGLLFYFTGDLEDSQQALTAEGDRALARGDVVSAAKAFVDAGLVARERLRPDDVTTLGERAEVLASSPLLTAEQRRAITSRIEHVERARSAGLPAGGPVGLGSP